MAKRKYRSPVSFVCDAIWACSRNSSNLAKDAQMILDSGNHALALSVAVLAMEELGKATMVDGLLLAKAGDHKAQAFEGGHRRHAKKLARVPGIGLWLQVVALNDPRAGTDTTFQTTMVAHERAVRAALRDVGRELDAKDGLDVLDAWKQRGFYVSAEQPGSVRRPEESVPPELARVVVRLAQCLATATEYVLDGNKQRYETLAKSIRGSMTEEEHQSLERSAMSLVNSVADDSRDPGV